MMAIITLFIASVIAGTALLIACKLSWLLIKGLFGIYRAIKQA